MFASPPRPVDRRARMPRAAMAAAAALLAPACSIRPPATGATVTPKQCEFVTEAMAPRDVAPATARGLAARIKDALAPGSAGSEQPEMLILSGGSENGAYGAGFLSEWAGSRGGRLPAFRVVTGVSTGALQATAAFTGDPSPLLEGGYLIDREEDLLQPYSGVTGGPRPSRVRLAAALIRHGALANLEPARARLRRILLARSRARTGTLLDAVAERAATGALLFVGVTDMDSGQAVAIDLTELASRWRAARDETRRSALADCYVDAVIASSSAPMAAPPVFMDGRMYADGGLRFGLFADEVSDALNKPTEGRTGGTGMLTLATEPRWRPRSYLIVNTHLDYAPRCPELLPARDRPATEPCYVGGVHAPWRFDQVALESERILANQIYRLSKERLVERIGSRSTQIPTDADIERDIATYPELGGRTCAYWRARDDAEYRPVQFHARYMRCMVGVGRGQYRREHW